MLVFDLCLINVNGKWWSNIKGIQMYCKRSDKINKRLKISKKNYQIIIFNFGPSSENVSNHLHLSIVSWIYEFRHGNFHGRYALGTGRACAGRRDRHRCPRRGRPCAAHSGPARVDGVLEDRGPETKLARCDLGSRKRR